MEKTKEPCVFCGKLVASKTMHERFCDRNPEAKSYKKKPRTKTQESETDLLLYGDREKEAQSEESETELKLDPEVEAKVRNLASENPKNSLARMFAKPTPMSASHKMLTEGDLKGIIEEIKGHLKTWKVEPGYFTMKEGLELLPIGTTSTDMKRVETITKINTLNDMAKAQENWMLYIYVIGGLAAVMVVAYMVISAFKGG